MHLDIKCLSSDILNAVSWTHDICLNDSRRQIYFWKNNVDQINQFFFL